MPASEACGTDNPNSANIRSLPISTRLSATTARRPRPGRAVKSVTGGKDMAVRRAHCTKARPKGCSLPCWAAAASASTSSAFQAGANRRSCPKRGCPSVSVPVLSKTTHVVRDAASNAPTPLTRMPWRAASPTPTMMAAGVASPKAQGQATTNTEMAANNPVCGCPSPHQTASVSSASATTAGTKIAETRSTSLCTGALEFWACRTKATMRPKVDSRPTAVVSTRNKPSPLVEPARMRSCGALSTGRDSPVTRDSSA